jgi:hypothetical protein
MGRAGLQRQLLVPPHPQTRIQQQAMKQGHRQSQQLAQQALKLINKQPPSQSARLKSRNLQVYCGIPRATTTSPCSTSTTMTSSSIAPVLGHGIATS